MALVEEISLDVPSGFIFGNVSDVDLVEPWLFFGKAVLSRGFDDELAIGCFREVSFNVVRHDSLPFFDLSDPMIVPGRATEYVLPVPSVILDVGILWLDPMGIESETLDVQFRMEEPSFDIVVDVVLPHPCISV